MYLQYVGIDVVNDIGFYFTWAFTKLINRSSWPRWLSDDWNESEFFSLGKYLNNVNFLLREAEDQFIILPI